MAKCQQHFRVTFLTCYSFAVGRLWHDVSSVSLSVRLSRMYCG